MNDWLQVFIVALLPLTALFTVIQTSPYVALISRGIMGVVAVMVYAIMGAADVALTEALVGTLLTVILFAITVRSSLAMRIGMLEEEKRPPQENVLRTFCKAQRLYMRWNSFATEKELVASLKAGRVDAVYISPNSIDSLKRYLPEDSEFKEPITMLAEHCRWHERKMNEGFEEGQVMRLKYRKTGGTP